MSNQKGFTVIELIAVIILLAIAGTVFYVQKQNLNAEHRDDQRKIAVNAIDYALKQVYYPENGFYPRTINQDTFTVLDEELLSDPSGRPIGDPASDYRYEPSQCDGDKCQQFSLRANLEREADYVTNSSQN